ncbi:MAG: S-layer protein [Paenibacillaceae bacterium]|jgi:hypothetical protein|nr:S-layer protein [Paenibacillaceae bacterium]
MKKTFKAGAVGLSAALLLAGALPAAAAPATASSAASSTVNSTSSAVSVPASDAPVDTNTAIKRDQAVELARKLAQVPQDYEVSNVSLQNAATAGTAGATWTINFSKQVKDKYYGNYYIGISAETGELNQMSAYINNVDAPPAYPPEKDLQAAKLVGEAFINSLYPGKLGETRYNTIAEDNFKTPLMGDVQYTYRYDRVVNGVLYPANGFSVNVNGSGQVVGFTYLWDKTTEFPDASTVISQEKAESIWKDKSQLTASYFRPYNKNLKSEPFHIAYRLAPVQLNALTGEVDSGNAPVQTSAGPIASAPLGSAPANDKALTQSQAIDAVTARFPLPAGAKLENASYQENTDNYISHLSRTWNISWTLPNEESTKSDASADKMAYPIGSRSIYANVDASTGEIRSYSRNEYRTYQATPVKPEDYKVAIDTAKTTAVELVKSLLPYMAHQLELHYSDPTKLAGASYWNSNPSYSFSFERVIDGISTGETVQVTVDATNGAVVNYNNNMTGYSFPATKPALVDPAQAKENLLGQYGLQLQYVVDWAAGYDYGNLPLEKYRVMVAAGELVPSAAGSQKVRLSYVPVVQKTDLVNSHFLDAQTGEWRDNRNGDPARSDRSAATDIAGHWAERALSLMVEYNAIDLKDGKANPDQSATRGELVKMLVLAASGGYLPMAYDSSRAASFKDVKASSALFGYVENAVDMNLIDRDPTGEFNPDQIMTRDDMAQMIVRALGYNKLAQQSGMFRLDVTDADAVQHKGHAAIAVGLEIMSIDGSQFRPADEVTRAQAATAFFRFLEKRGTL